MMGQNSSLYLSEGESFGITHKAQKEEAFILLVIHNSIEGKEWRGRISTKVDKSFPHSGSPCGEARVLQFPSSSTSVVLCG